MKAVLLLLVLLLAYWLFWGRHTGKSASSSPRRGADPEKMVVCAHCHLHFPKSEAVVASNGQYYCCNEHRELGTA
jgi:uncharacterized protein